MSESTTINLSLPKALVQRADVQAKREYTSRSDVFRRAILELLKREEAEAEGEWHNVFHDEKGVPVDDFLKALRELDER
jgi:metal-responsive CopG/Arc/MetJ family transcriptional regulator